MILVLVRRPVPLLVVLLAVACRGERGGDAVARAVADGVRAQLGVDVESIVCTRDRCDVTMDGGVTLHVTVTGERDVTWESDEVIRTAPIAARVQVELDELGILTEVDCGPALVAVAPGAATRVSCSFGGGGQAWVDVAPDGGVELEVAIGADSVRARTEPFDEGRLDQQSRALDSDEAEGVLGEGDDDGGVDAGVDAGSTDAGPTDAP